MSNSLTTGLRAPLLLLATSLILAGCAQPERAAQVTICDPHCSERPRDGGTPDLKPLPATSPQTTALIAAARDNPRAAYDLALRYFRGDGVPRDTYQALTWMRTAAEGGELQAQAALGKLYMTGLDEMGSDPREAQSWLMTAAARGDKESAQLLQEAEAQRRDEQAEYRWQQYWRSIVSRGWYGGYPYYGNWNGAVWIY